MRWFLHWLFGTEAINRYSPGDTFETHECVFCKRDPDASWCIPKPVKKDGTQE